MKFIGQLVFSLMNFLYRASGGRIGGKMGQVEVLLLTTTGRKSGKKRTLPLVYIMDGPAYVITASAGGADKNPGWFFNVRSNPQSLIQVREKQIKVISLSHREAEQEGKFVSRKCGGALPGDKFPLL